MTRRILLCGSEHVQHSASTTVEKISKSTWDVECGNTATTAGVPCAAGTTPVNDESRSRSGNKRTADSDEMALAIRATRHWGCVDTYGKSFKGQETTLRPVERDTMARATALSWL